MLHREPLLLQGFVSDLDRVGVLTPSHKRFEPLMKKINQEGAVVVAAGTASRLPSAPRLPDAADAAAQTRRAGERASERAARLRWRRFAINLVLAASLQSVTVICASKTKQNKQFPLRVFLILLRRRGGPRPHLGGPPGLLTHRTQITAPSKNQNGAEGKKQDKRAVPLSASIQIGPQRCCALR